MNRICVVAIACAGVVLLAGCEPSDDFSGTVKQRMLDKYDIPGTHVSITEFCRGEHKYMFMSGSLQGSLQKWENHTDCKEK